VKRIILAAALALLSLPAVAQIVSGGAASVVPLYVTGIAGANTAVTNVEEQLLTYTVPAGVLVNAGDTLHIVVGGQFAATTDSKTAFVRLNSITGQILSQPVGATASATRWTVEAWVTKTPTSGTSYTYTSIAGVANASNGGIASGTTNITDTAVEPIVVSGKNATSSAAGSVTAQYLGVWLIRAP